jgi:DNA-binding MarR family transcriptional regulator
VEVSYFRKEMLEYIRRINENTNKMFLPIIQQYGLTMLQYMILVELKNSPHTIGSLAYGIHAAGPNISSICKKLENRKILMRVRDSEDERVVKVTLAPKGNEIVSEVEEQLNERINRVEGVTEETFNEIIRGLEQLNCMLEKVVVNQ